MRATSHMRASIKAGQLAINPRTLNRQPKIWVVPLWSNFQISVWPIWSVAFDWEAGDDQPPNIGIDNKNIVVDGQLPRRKSIDELLTEIEQLREQREAIAV